jgi:methionyl-tRNA formyltransferase
MKLNSSGIKSGIKSEVMNILLLTPAKNIDAIRGFFADDKLTVTDGPIIESSAKEFDLGVSYGYRYILKPDVLAVLPVVNLHIAYLPWNKGADPNLWSWIENTPKGVTIHWCDNGVDTGDIIAQCTTDMRWDETLATSYEKLQADLLDLFRETWPKIRCGEAPRTPQPKTYGSLHRIRDREEVAHLLTDGWNTKVYVLEQEFFKDED